ncbi:MAG: glycoside hydrolase [Dysgonamonadaceae bacterium]|nr:glycoside hydrolase [Dysgonamonadaceae bacterium]
MKKIIFTAFLIVIPLVISAESADRPKTLKPWSKGAFETKQYRNLFAEAGYPQQEIDRKLDSIFNAVFFGEDRVYFEVGDTMAYVSDLKNHDVRTEGMSYGMMIAVQFDRKDIFDRLWRWCTTYMQHKDGPSKGYFAWSCKIDGTRNAQGPASDGELYYVTALIFASNRWGNTSGIDYLKEAQHILQCSWDKDGSEGMTPFIHKEKKLITFTPETAHGYGYTDLSYHIPAFYEVWARWANDGHADFWRECATESRKFFHKAVDPVTGLNPDQSEYDGTPRKSPWGGQLSDFRFDSWRVPMNVALDFSWACADPKWQTEYGDKIQDFLYSQGLYTFNDQFKLDGSKPDWILPAGGKTKLRHSVGLIATSAAVSLACDHPKSYEFIDHFWNTKNVPYDDGYFDAYYDGLLQLFAFMHLSGNYQIIFPK